MTPESGSLSAAAVAAPIPTATAGRRLESGKMGRGEAGGGAEEDRREDRAAAEAGQGDPSRRGP